jgi:23S rRNA (pseudouridine1915-N3)-methyltransferase
VDLAKRLDEWQMKGSDVVFAIGGSDGLSDAVFNRADERASLSALTFPHHMVKVILAEALYRAWTINSGHPYHRASPRGRQRT